MRKTIYRYDPANDSFIEETIDAPDVIVLDKAKARVIAQWIQQGYMETSDIEGLCPGTMSYPVVKKFIEWRYKELRKQYLCYEDCSR